MQKIKLPIEETKEDKISPTKPDFSWTWRMILFSLWFIIITFWFFYGFSYFVISKISIEDEKKYFWSLYVEKDMKKFDLDFLKTKVKKFQNYDIYIKDSDEINAFASPWANIFLTKALLENVENEEELIFVLAHEIWHIEKRHILKRFSLEMPFSMTLNFLWLNFWDWIIDSQKLLWDYFSRNDEKEADKEAMKLVNSLWLNLKCSTRFFERFKENNSIEIPEILSTHPSDTNRIKNLLKENKNPKKDCIIFEKNKKD